MMKTIKALHSRLMAHIGSLGKRKAKPQKAASKKRKSKRK
jgi:hypothetical protein